MRSRQRTLLIALLVLLALLACGLLSFYVWIGQPVSPAERATIEGLTHERSIYPPVVKQTSTFKRPSRIAVAAPFAVFTLTAPIALDISSWIGPAMISSPAQ